MTFSAEFDKVDEKDPLIKEISYLDVARELQVHFNYGARYKYVSVPRCIFEDMRISEDPLMYFDQNIKDTFVCEGVSFLKEEEHESSSIAAD